MDCTIVCLQNAYCFHDNIITVSTVSESDHITYFAKCPKKLDEDNLRINLQKCHFAKTDIEWLQYKFTKTGISLLENISYISNTTTYKDLFLVQYTT